MGPLKGDVGICGLNNLVAGCVAARGTSFLTRATLVLPPETFSLSMTYSNCMLKVLWAKIPHSDKSIPVVPNFVTPVTSDTKNREDSTPCDNKKMLKCNSWCASLLGRPIFSSCRFQLLYYKKRSILVIQV